MIAETIVLLRSGPGFFAVTGWGVFYIVCMVCIVSDLWKRGR